MRYALSVIFSIISFNSFTQSIESITYKLSDKICECISADIQAYADIKPEFNRCYDSIYNKIFDIVDPSERKLLLEDETLMTISNNIIPTLNANCQIIRKFITSDVQSSVKPTTQNPCPTNFDGSKVSQLGSYHKEIIAFNALITDVHYSDNNLPYYQVTLEGGASLWIASLVNSGFEKKDKIIRVLGYVVEVEENDEFSRKHNKSAYHILVFGILDWETKQMAAFPGSELQVKEWLEGTIPRSKP